MNKERTPTQRLQRMNSIVEKLHQIYSCKMAKEECSIFSFSYFKIKFWNFLSLSFKRRAFYSKKAGYNAEKGLLG